VILTQPQSDHMTGLIEVLKRFKVKHVIESGITSNSFIYSEWLRIVKDKNIPYTVVRTGEEINLGNDTTIEVLHPPASLLQNTFDDINNNCLTLRLNYHKISFLLTADIFTEAEWYLISQRAKLQSTVLKIAHHGSQSSTSSELLSVANPSTAVISVSSNNNFGHPHAAVITKLRQKLGEDKIFLTSKNGTVEFITDGNILWVKTEQ
jgi:competence protein ComEC